MGEDGGEEWLRSLSSLVPTSSTSPTSSTISTLPELHAPTEETIAARRLCCAWQFQEDATRRGAKGRLARQAEACGDARAQRMCAKKERVRCLHQDAVAVRQHVHIWEAARDEEDAELPSGARASLAQAPRRQLVPALPRDDHDGCPPGS